MKPLIRYFLIVIFALRTRADEAVVPAAQATQAGNSSVLLSGPGTIDEVYGAKSFSGPETITEVAFRLDQATGGGSFEVTIPRVVIRMSTFQGTYSSFVATGGYDSNKGVDDTVVFDGSIHWTSTDLPSTAPNSFDLRIPLSLPFTYDAGKGPLLVRFQSLGSFTGGMILDSEGHGDPSIGWFADKTLGNLVTQFSVTPVPEPSMISLLTVGAGASLCLRKKS